MAAEALSTIDMNHWLPEAAQPLHRGCGTGASAQLGLNSGLQAKYLRSDCIVRDAVDA